MDAAALQAFEVQLLAMRDALLELASSAQAQRQPIELDQARQGRLSRMDALQGQAMAQEAKRRRDLELRKIAAALRRIAADEFGYCVSCGDEIARARLQVDPSISLCIECATAGEANRP